VCYFGLSEIKIFSVKDHVKLVEDLCSVLTSICAGITIAVLCSTPNRLILIVFVLVLIQSGYAIYYQHAGINTFVAHGIVRAGGTFNDPAGICISALIVLPLVVAQGFHTDEKGRSYWLIGLPIMLAGFMLSASTFSTIALTMSLAWLLSRLIYDKRIVMTVGMCIFCLLLLIFYHRGPFFLTIGSLQGAIDQQLSRWHTGAAPFEHNWLVGSGLRNTDAWNGSTMISDETSAATAVAANDILIFWLNEFGIAGGLLFAVFSATIYYALRPHMKTAVGLGLTASWIALAVDGIFDVPFGVGGLYFGNALVGCLTGATMLLNVYGLTGSKAP
jgi:hypothetical protein